MMKKRAAVAAVTALLVCIAVYLNWSYQKNDLPDASMVDASLSQTGDVSNFGDTTAVNASYTDEATAAALTEYFSGVRLQRQQARDSALTILDEKLHAEGVTETVQAEASGLAETIARNAIREANIEGIVLSKGYTNCMAYIGDSGLTVIVTARSGSLSALDTARITDVAISETGLSADKIKIVEAKPAL